MKIIAIHSFRRGVGKSILTANLAASMAETGSRVGIMDMDFQSPGIHLLFNYPEKDLPCTLNDYLWGQKPINACVYDVSSRLGLNPGKLWICPANPQSNEVLAAIRTSYDLDHVNEGIEKLEDMLQLDTLLLDTTAGLNEQTMIPIAVSQKLVVILRPDLQDYQGTAVTVEIGRSLQVPEILLVMNETPDRLDESQAKEQLKDKFNCQVGAVLPHCDELMDPGSRGVFVLSHPRHPFAVQLAELAKTIIA